MFPFVIRFVYRSTTGAHEVECEPLPGVLGNTGTVAFIFREQGIFSNYFQGTGELLTRLLGSFLGTRDFSNGEQGIKSKKVKGSWEHAPPPPGRGSLFFFFFLAFMGDDSLTYKSLFSNCSRTRRIPHRSFFGLKHFKDLGPTLHACAQPITAVSYTHLTLPTKLEV